MSATNSQPLSQSVDEVQTSAVPVTQCSGPLCEDAVTQSSTPFCDDAVTQSSGLLCDDAVTQSSGPLCDDAVTQSSTPFCDDAVTQSSGPLCDVSDVVHDVTESQRPDIDDLGSHHETIQSRDTEAGTTVFMNSVPAATVTSRDTEAGTQSTSAGCQSPGRYVQKPVPLRSTPQSGRRPFPRISPAYTVHNNGLDDAPNQVSLSPSATSTDTGLPSQDCNLSGENDVSILTSRHVRHTSEPFSVTDAVSMDVKGRAELTSQLNSSMQISSASFKHVAESASLPSTPVNVIFHTSLLA